MRISWEESVVRLQAGEVVAIPTDTVVGLAASISFGSAITQLYRLKRRPQHNPLLTLIASLQQIESYIPEPPPHFVELTDQFWPGALSLVVPVEGVSPVITAGTKEAGFRCPDCLLTRRLLDAVGPCAVASANLSGSPSAVTVADVENDFGADFPILAADSRLKGIESTVLVFRHGKWSVARLGGVSRDQLAVVLGYQPAQIGSPAANERHYRPRARLIRGTTPYTGAPPVVLGFSDRHYPGAKRVVELGSVDDPEEVARRLYSCLRQLDQEGIGEAWVDLQFPKEGVLAVVADRLLQAVHTQ